jgi:hypothetical protein
VYDEIIYILQDNDFGIWFGAWVYWILDLDTKYRDWNFAYIHQVKPVKIVLVRRVKSFRVYYSWTFYNIESTIFLIHLPMNSIIQNKTYKKPPYCGRNNFLNWEIPGFCAPSEQGCYIKILTLTSMIKLYVLEFYIIYKFKFFITYY